MPPGSITLAAAAPAAVPDVSVGQILMVAAGFFLIGVWATAIAYAVGGFRSLPHKPAMREPGSGVPLAVALCVALLMMLIPAQVAFAVGYLPGGGAEIPPDKLYVVSGISSLLSAGAAVLTIGVFRRSGYPARLQLGGRALLAGLKYGPGWLAVVMPWMLCAAYVASAVLVSLGQAPNKTHQLLTQMNQAESPGTLAIFIVTAVVIAPLFEEILFRGLIQNGLAAAFESLAGTTTTAPRWAAILMTAGGFALVHELWSAPLIFLLAVMLGWLYERCRSLWVPIFVHVGFNAFFTLVSLSQR